MAYITCNDLTLGYDGKVIVSGLNFEVKKGDYLCVVGENGTGKSTLIKTLLRLQEAVSGQIIKLAIFRSRLWHRRIFRLQFGKLYYPGRFQSAGKSLFMERQKKLLRRKK